MSIDNSQTITLRRQVLEKEFSRMNDRQQQAVFHTEGPLLILAGAGSGKTTVLVNRIANLVRYGKAYHSTFVQPAFTDEDAANCENYLQGGELDALTQARLSVSACLPWKIMAITFTNKAAGELKDRLCAMLGEDGQEIWAATFHSSCARMLRRHGERLGFSSHFTIYDTDDSRRLMKEVMRDLEINEKTLSHKSILGEIARAKDSLVGPEEYEAQVGADFRLKAVARAYRAYQRRLTDADAMDFDDLLVNTVRLFKQCPDVLEYYQDRFRYIMVDEYQDTNHAQYEFVRLLAEKSNNLCVVGDDDQSIYKFRGATIENIMNFEQDFTGAVVVRLEQNYRSTQNILDAANAVIAHNLERKGKTLWTSAGAGDKIHLHTAENEQDEAERVSRVILDGVAKGRKFSDYAVLYRMNSQSLTFERMFARSGVPHRIIGGHRFFDRKEVRDMIAYLSVINNPGDEIRLRRIINTPKRSIGEKTADTAAMIGQQVGETMFQVISHPEDFPAISRAAGKLLPFVKMMQGLIDKNEAGMAPSELYAELLEQTRYVNFLKTDEPEKAEGRTENVQELSSMLQRYEEENGEEASLSGFLEEVALFTDIDNYDAEADSTVLMTVHSAKGLEFPVVFLPGWEEGVFPGNAVIFDPSQVEEERRLAYVAITRAREELYIYNAESRMIFGSTTRNRASRFTDEVPQELTERTRSREYLGRGNTITGTVGAGQAGGRAKISYRPKPHTPTPAGTYQVGDSVQHKTFGNGLIVSATPIANDTLLEIAFDKGGTKKLMANFARLTKL
ncbi:ATP-dependent helicase [Acutalibacter caecimuris]|uniref:ATP-dependent helicase n=1 Tax=Acutalibacter caecimuris TaxID=3093657 RepID=UPI002AC9800E|nr:UvrD-helicase domain-containing protein [Acutalibacter sp. M00118]